MHWAAATLCHQTDARAVVTHNVDGSHEQVQLKGPLYCPHMSVGEQQLCDRHYTPCPQCSEQACPHGTVLARLEHAGQRHTHHSTACKGTQNTHTSTKQQRPSGNGAHAPLPCPSLRALPWLCLPFALCPILSHAFIMLCVMHCLSPQVSSVRLCRCMTAPGAA